MQYVWMFVIGIVIGIIARFLMPGEDRMGWIMTGLLGIVGSFVGGLIQQFFFAGGSTTGALQPAGFIMSVIGAMIVLFLWQRLR